MIHLCVVAHSLRNTALVGLENSKKAVHDVLIYSRNLGDQDTWYGKSARLLNNAAFTRFAKNSDEPLYINNLHMQAFINAKCILACGDVLSLYMPNAPMQLLTDASLKNDLGFVLKQQQADLSWRSIKARSRTLQGAEETPIELELQAIAYVTKRCHTFVNDHRFKVCTDGCSVMTIGKKRS